MTKHSKQSRIIDSALSSIRAQASTETRSVTFGVVADVWLGQMLDLLDEKDNGN